ncbi:hypothetical protein IPM62_00965 [Candidatus Woesebacteria bacterium]|nr:MAG: hypothetical protein IPM62_00965 [Candidatus Woesebacteria bacterium]
MREKLEQAVWWDYLENDLKELLMQSVLLWETAVKWQEKLATKKKGFHDYAFIVFPAAKAYEGFLKTLFLDMGFITKKEYQGKRIRIGKALNPTLYQQEIKKNTRYVRLRKKISVYDKIIEYCGGPYLADVLWTTWKECRNMLFHWYPSEKNAIDFDEAESRVMQIINTMNLAFKECKINYTK